MTKTKYYDLQMDDPQDDYDVEVVNANLKKIDEQMKTRENATDALQEPEFTVADKRENIASKEKMQKILGKIAKFFTDLKTVAFTGNYKDLSNKPTSLPASDVSAWAKESTKPKYTKAEVGLGNVGNFKAVSTVASQGLTNTEKSNARANIGAQAAGSYASSTHNHDSTYRKKLLGTMDGDGKTSYCQLCTLKISQNYINTPIEITLQERCRSTLDRLSILFGSINNTNPSLDRFTVFGESCDWYISKTAASTWVIYGLKGESWAGIKVVDYTGIPGIDITWNMTGVSSLPDSKTQALWGGNVHYAETAGNVVNNQTTTKAGFALDARQANPNLDGTLAKQVADLNGSLNSKKIPSFGIENIFTGNPFCIVNNGSDVISVQTDWDIDNGGYKVKNIKYPAGTATNLTVSLSLPANSIVIVDVNTLNGENIDIQGSLIRSNFTSSPKNWNLSIKFTGCTNQILTDIRYMPLVIHLG